MKKRIILLSYVITYSALINGGEATYQQDLLFCIEQDAPRNSSNQTNTFIFCPEKGWLKLEDWEKSQCKGKPCSGTREIQRTNIISKK